MKLTLNLTRKPSTPESRNQARDRAARVGQAQLKVEAVLDSTVGQASLLVLVAGAVGLAGVVERAL